MTNKKYTDEDDYYAQAKKRIAEEAQKAHRIHEEDVHLHLVAHIPYYEDAWEKVRRLLVKLNNLLLHRFDQPGMIYWDFFKKTPSELSDYAPDFGTELSRDEQATIIRYLEQKKREEENMVEIGFDEDGEEDGICVEESESDDDKDDENGDS
jgi:hypothetical protein